MDRDEPTPAGIHEVGTNNRPFLARNERTFSQYLVFVLTHVDPNFYYILLGLLIKLAMDGANRASDSFEGVCGAVNDNPKVVLKFGEAFLKSLGDIQHMSMFIMVYGASQILTLLRSQLLAGTLVSLAPYHYFPPLLAKAPNFSVFCGTFELPIFCFVFLWALVFSLLQSFVVLLGLFISWRKLMRCDRNEVPTSATNIGGSNDMSNEQEMVEALRGSIGGVPETEDQSNFEQLEVV